MILEIYVYGLVGSFAGHLLVIYLFNNMEPEKKCICPIKKGHYSCVDLDCSIHGEPEKKTCSHNHDKEMCIECCPAVYKNHLPEKKDVWGEFDKIKLSVKIWPNSEENYKEAKEKGMVVDVIWEMIKPDIKSFIKTHFIPRAEGIDKYIEGHKDGRKEFIVELVEKIEKLSIDFSKKSKEERLNMDDGDIGYMNGVNGTVERILSILS